MYDYASRSFTLRSIAVGEYIVIHFGNFEIRVTRSAGPHYHLPLRFVHACVYPAVLGHDSPTTSSLPVEVIHEIFMFLTISDMGNFSQSSRYTDEAFKLNTLWSRLITNLKAYVTLSVLPEVGDLAGGPMMAIAELVKRRQHRRLGRFFHTVESSHWAAPTRIVHSIPHIQGRRIDVVDDLDLF
jgi:hypothetical protein